MHLRTPVNYIARKILYLWVKTDVLHAEDIEHADKNKAFVYVLTDRSWADLLVMEQECERLQLPMPLAHVTPTAFKRWHQVYTVVQKQPLKAWLQQKTKRSAMLIDLLHTLKLSPQQDVQFVPVTIFWGRPVAKQKHWLNVLFADTWGIAGRTRRFFTILFNGRDTLVQFSEIISFRQQINANLTDEQIIDQTQALLVTRLNEIKTATLGPDVSHRRTLIRTLLNKPDVRTAIRKYSSEKKITEYRSAQRAQKYLTEIVANCNYITIQLLQRVLTAFWNKFYCGIDVFHSKKLRHIARTHALIYVPSHRSHIDYLLLSYIVHSEGLAIPYIAAGKNLNMPFIGPILRKGGAFFIRRTFKGNPLYSTVMFEYLASLVSTGMPVEYFIEGGRSRTGRLLKPKPGMLAMTIRAFLKYHQRPVAFIPVSIGYEKMIEGRAYLAELKGDDKKSENLLDSIKSFFNIRGNYGRVSTSFGDPVYLNEMLDRTNPGWKTCKFDDNNRPDWLATVVKTTAENIMRNINQASHVNAVNLISTALLATGNQAIDEGELLQTLDVYIELIRSLAISDNITITSISTVEQIKRAEELKLVKRHQHEMGDFIYLDRPMAILLTYYRNNIIHLLTMPSLIACCFTNTATIRREKIIHFISIAYPFLRAELYLPWAQEEIENIIDLTLNQLSNMGLLIKGEEIDSYSRPKVNSGEMVQLQHLCRIISPVLELYYIIFALLAFRNKASITRNHLEHLCHLMAQRISLIHEINSPDFFDKKLIANFIDSLIDFDYATVDNNNTLTIRSHAIEKGRQARHLLDRAIQYNIFQMLRTCTKNETFPEE